MKAIVRTKYGSPDVLKLEEIPEPTAGDDEVLVKVQAVGVNAADLENLRADPLYVRFSGFDLLTPKIKVLGSERVESKRLAGTSRSFSQVTRYSATSSTTGWVDSLSVSVCPKVLPWC